MSHKKAAVIFPHHLYRDHPSLRDPEISTVFLVEEDRFFTDFNFNKKKLVLHRASMRGYQELLLERGLEVEYLEKRRKETLPALFSALQESGIEIVRTAEIIDHPLEASFFKGLEAKGIRIEVDDSPGFLTSRALAPDLLRGRGRISMASFYRRQRLRLKVLVEDGRPLGGRWSFDPVNRRRIPKEAEIPPPPALELSSIVREAKGYVEERFPNNPGSVDGFNFPTTFKEAELWLQDFLVKRLASFGDYEDAMRRDDPFLFHSLLSSSLNIGLLTPREVLDRTLAHASEVEVPINSLEGFIRQLIGWREFMRAAYLIEGDRERRSNFWSHHEKIPPALYSGTTGISPVDQVVGRAIDHSYAHHIERLMVLGSFMNLCEIDPAEVYRWFMEIFIDSCDWAMVPNVYGMSTYADGGLITTKPYISGSSYLRRMGDWPQGEWAEIWDGLFWRFVHLHRDVFAENPRTRVLAHQLDRIGEERLERHLEVAEGFLRSFRRGDRSKGEVREDEGSSRNGAHRVL